MARLHHQMPKLLRIALLLLLLSMQGFSSAHEIDKGQAHDSSVCVTCSIGGGNVGVPSATVECPVTASNGSQPVFTPAITPAAALRQIPEARAPPVTL